MTSWDDLLSVALVGTERRPLPDAVAEEVAQLLGPGHLPQPASDVAAGDATSSSSAMAPETSVLRAAGVLSAYRRCGVGRVQGDRALMPAEPDHRPVPSDTANQILELLLGGQISTRAASVPLVQEWLERCASGGRRLPERFLPSLVEAATTNKALRAGTLAAGGSRLRWLARHNPRWSWAASASGALERDAALTGEALVRAWATGSPDERMQVLVAQREVAPHAGLELLSSTWSTEAARDRAALLSALEVGLSHDDEPFLERALDDRAKSVKERAAVLLGRLPESARAQRMAERLRELVVAGPGGALTVELPDEPDAAARRDGIVDSGGPARTGRRSWWLIQIVGSAPLTAWIGLAGETPGSVLERIVDPNVRRGLILAAQRQRDHAWASALVRHHGEPALLPLVPLDEIDDLAAPLFEAVTDPNLAALINALPGPWSRPLSDLVVDRLRSVVVPGLLEQVVAAAQADIHPDAVHVIEEWVEQLRDDDYSRRIVRGLAHALNIRRTMAQELS